MKRWRRAPACQALFQPSMLDFYYPVTNETEFP